MKKYICINNRSIHGKMDFIVGETYELDERQGDILTFKGHFRPADEVVTMPELNENQIKQLELLRETKELKRKYNKK